MLVSDLYCPSCRNAKDHKPQDNEVCWSCVAMGGAGNYKQSKTRYDEIHAMSAEELADWVWGVETAGRAYGPRGKKAWLDWLKEEVSE